jgi:uncharacterized protein
MIYLATFIVFGLAITGMAIGVIFSGRKLSGSCGGVGVNGEGLGDCLCARKDADICASDHGNELVALAELGYPRRKEGHDHDHEQRTGSAEGPQPSIDV